LEYFHNSQFSKHAPIQSNVISSQITFSYALDHPEFAIRSLGVEKLLTITETDATVSNGYLACLNDENPTIVAKILSQKNLLSMCDPVQAFPILKRLYKNKNFSWAVSEIMLKNAPFFTSRPEFLDEQFPYILDVITETKARVWLAPVASNAHPFFFGLKKGVTSDTIIQTLAKTLLHDATHFGILTKTFQDGFAQDEIIKILECCLTEGSNSAMVSKIFTLVKANITLKAEA
jgi:hypothetical protein